MFPREWIMKPCQGLDLFGSHLQRSLVALSLLQSDFFLPT